MKIVIKPTKYGRVGNQFTNRQFCRKSIRKVCAQNVFNEFSKVFIFAMLKDLPFHDFVFPESFALQT
jgi:hypothetical protein